MRNWIDLFEAAHGLPIGPISHCPIRNTGELAHVEDVLSAWVCGEMDRADPYLKEIKAALEPYRRNLVGATLYRGITVPQQQIKTALKKGITIEHRGKVHESWSLSPSEVARFMVGWSDPWIMLTANSDDLDVVVDMMEFDREAQPFTQMREQHEIIVCARPQQHFTAKQVSLPRDIHDEYDEDD
jgi:hypothetical protein